MRLSPDVIALHLSDLEGVLIDEHAQELRKQWVEEVEGPAHRVGVRAPRLYVIHSRYRKFLEPIVHFIERFQKEHPAP